MNRRAFVRRVGVGSSVGVAGLAGCFTREESDDPQEDTDNGPADDALRVATYSSMVTGETSAGAWLKETFEEEYDADLRWRVPEAGIDHFIRRGELETSLGADVYLGLTAGDLVRIDDALSAGALFERIDREVLEHDQRIRSDLAFDDPRRGADQLVGFRGGLENPLGVRDGRREWLLGVDVVAGLERIDEHVGVDARRRQIDHDVDIGACNEVCDGPGLEAVLVGFLFGEVLLQIATGDDFVVLEAVFCGKVGVGDIATADDGGIESHALAFPFGAVK